mmetsp:Transcript_32611/g.60274  ORF Transcript_32611/g.60274 Transcript_32611/m.60274 type:complete len:293 (+) Transcript_32611:179-1057(+)|eukprot:CAMPEP_0201878374 /NCGR_PEP_ID=MMETSP0902-20130614/9545_1 /ASSEMBLY_ACC=CAM_ASM_000551 /TAXON_ID=420261 /ORGANISM="Thalassiosira antarctica, Strain CCMP982" /LENGTH=292 /DNA_ID=CAMNT_0048406001 /DNA_START=102 /DNA_END=980 /DNA_ORIENTATION=+
MAAAAILVQQCKFLTLSFSGAGHLLPYHLGVATALRANNNELIAMNKPVRAVSGSSSGAIAATLFVYFSNDRIKEYADRFISDGGRAMYHLEKMMDENKEGSAEYNNNTSLHIATTRCSNGSLHLFDFPPKLSSMKPSDKDHLVKCLEASCKIPQYFHPSDVLLPSRLWPSSSSLTYPEEDGVVIDGTAYVDGGISAPAPPTHVDSMDGACRVVISPIAGGNKESIVNTIRISPKDDSWKFPLDLQCKGGFAVHPSVQNIKAMQVSAGLASPSLLREWFERGVEDGTSMLTD